ncbi:hypothetical protein QN277_016103 [Acacia crassicarpa]|uniref:Uncharacterized protein n=1 Tax=Acacia crassicarpa TaxID=499986 RepID=A0AAE1MVY1_9FABA|nr:hypothetical protein QN277_016103 [Acacia crassicarpa]
MNCVFGNCRGRVSKALPGLIKEIKKRYFVDFLALFETKANGSQAQRQCQKLGFDHFEITSLGSNHTIDQFFSNALMTTLIEDKNDPSALLLLGHFMRILIDS